MRLKQYTVTPPAGWALFIIGLGLACFTWGISLVLCLAAFCMYEKRAVCLDCRWKWKP